MLHRHAGHGEAVARINWCVAEQAIGVITGEVGAGKTVAVRAALAGLDPSRHAIIYLANPATGTRGIHAGIVTALGGIPKFHTASLIPQTAELLAAEHNERGRAVTVICDEAHLLDASQLEALRLLTNADMDSHSPFACLLIGQPTLRRRIKLGTGVPPVFRSEGLIGSLSDEGGMHGDGEADEVFRGFQGGGGSACDRVVASDCRGGAGDSRE